MVNDSEKGVAEDKLRLFLLYYLSVDDVPAADMNDFEAALRRAGCEIAALTYLRRIRAFGRMIGQVPTVAQTTGTARGGDLFGKFGSLHSKFTEGLKEGRLIDSAVELFKSGVKTLIGKDNLPITHITEQLLDPKIPDTDEFLYFDPKAKRTDGRQIPRQKPLLQDAIVFVVGGGNYIEYQALQELALKPPGRTVVYGTTQMMNAHEFVTQITHLGEAATK